MDEKIEALRRRVQAEPDDFLASEALERLLVNAGRFDDILPLRIFLRFRRGEITLKQICAAASLDYKPAQNICDDYKVDLKWNSKRIIDLVKLLDKRDKVLFACDCAERTLGIYEKEYPDDRRLHNALFAIRRSSDAQEHVLFAAMAAFMEANREAWAAKDDPFRQNTTMVIPASYVAFAVRGAIRAAAMGYINTDVNDAMEHAVTACASAAYNSSYTSNLSTGISKIARDNAETREIAWQQNRLAEYLVGDNSQ